MKAAQINEYGDASIIKVNEVAIYTVRNSFSGKISDRLYSAHVRKRIHGKLISIKLKEESTQFSLAAAVLAISSQ